jgi:hypothetical protein
MNLFHPHATKTATSDTRKSVFQQDWWLKIAGTGTEYTELQVRKKGVVVATLPCAIMRTNQQYFRVGGSPPWSRICHPILADTLNENEKREVLRELIGGLPRGSLRYVVGPDTNTKDSEVIRKAFVEARFKHIRVPTYSETADDPDIMSRLDSRHRGNIRSAERDLEILGTDSKNPVSAADFIHFYEHNLNARGLKSYISLETARALIEHGQKSETFRIRILAARRKKTSPSDPDFPWDAATASAWDDQRYYNWMVTYRQDSESYDGIPKPHPHAIKLLIVKAANYARELGLRYDVDGASTEGRRKFYKQILRFPHEEYRDEYERETIPRRFFMKLERQSRRYAAQIERYTAFAGLRQASFPTPIKSA